MPHRIAIDARYLKRRGIGISLYLQQAISDLLTAQTDVTLLTNEQAHAAALLREYPSARAIALPGRNDLLWEQRVLRRHLAASSYEGFIAPANRGIPLTYRGSTRLILVVHDLVPLRLPHLYLLPRPLWALRYLLSLGIAAARADQIIAVSQATARDVGRLLHRSALGVVYPPIPAPATRPVADSADRADCAQAGQQLTQRYFVYNGGTDIRKNVPTLLRAFARVREVLPAIDLVILGTGYEGFQRKIERLRITGHVHMPGYVDEAAKTAILAGAVALVYPSRLEGFGLPVVEAFAVGIPVVSGTGGSLREIGGDAVTYVDPLDRDSLAAAMIAVTSGTARLRAGSAGAVQLALLQERRDAATFAGVIASCLPARAG
jgi:glycosyltransferase involved in cell wall biosynthesis